MAIYLDSAIIPEAREAVELGWLYGITTNPTLLAKSQLPPTETYRQLAMLPIQEVYYQVSATDLPQMHKEIKTAQALLGNKLVVKIPPTRPGFRLAAEISEEHKTCITAIFDPAQALAAQAAGANYIAVYVNRATKWMGDGLRLTRAIAEVLTGSKTEILAASLKSTDEVVAAHNAGAHHLTLPLKVLNEMTASSHSSKAVEEFMSSGIFLE